MAANKFATMLHKNTNRITLVLVYMLLEWVLIVLLLLNSLFSYLIIKFADYFGLKRPCLWCSRLDHIFEPSKYNDSYRDLVCDDHANEISKLGFCSNHRKLAESRDMCEDCLSSSRSENVDDNFKCSCCDVVLEKKWNLAYFKIKPSWEVLDNASDGIRSDEHRVSDELEKEGFSCFISSFDCNQMAVNEDDLVIEKAQVTMEEEEEEGELNKSMDVKGLLTQRFDCTKEESSEILAKHLEFYIEGDDFHLIPIDLMDSTGAGSRNLYDFREEDQGGVDNGDVIMDFDLLTGTPVDLVVENGCSSDEKLTLVSALEIENEPGVEVVESMESNEKRSFSMHAREQDLMVEEVDQRVGCTREITTPLNEADDVQGNAAGEQDLVVEEDDQQHARTQEITTPLNEADDVQGNAAGEQELVVEEDDQLVGCIREITTPLNEADGVQGNAAGEQDDQRVGCTREITTPLNEADDDQGNAAGEQDLVVEGDDQRVGCIREITTPLNEADGVQGNAAGEQDDQRVGCTREITTPLNEADDDQGNAAGEQDLVVEGDDQRVGCIREITTPLNEADGVQGNAAGEQDDQRVGCIREITIPLNEADDDVQGNAAGEQDDQRVGCTREIRTPLNEADDDVQGNAAGEQDDQRVGCTREITTPLNEADDVQGNAAGEQELVVEEDDQQHARTREITTPSNEADDVNQVTDVAHHEPIEDIEMLHVYECTKEDQFTSSSQLHADSDHGCKDSEEETIRFSTATVETGDQIESLHILHNKLLLLDGKETGTEDSVDGSVFSDIEGTDGVLTVEKLKCTLKTERRALNALYRELEEERSASAVAASQTMAMISRLQEEKAAMQMEALQYQRMMEEQSEYDQEALQIMNELMVKREKEKAEIEKELDVYRRKVQDYEAKERMIMLRRRKEDITRSASSASCSNTEDSDGVSVDLSHESKEEESFENSQIREDVNPNTPADAVLYLEESLASFEEERLSILEQLKVLEEKLVSLNDEEQQQHHLYEENGNGFHENPDFVYETNGVANGHYKGVNAKKLLPLFDATDAYIEDNISNEHEDGLDSVGLQHSSSTNSVLESKKVAYEEEVDHVYERLQALEADREFLKHCISSLKKGDKGIYLLQEILQHLRDLRSVELRAKSIEDAAV